METPYRVLWSTAASPLYTISTFSCNVRDRFAIVALLLKPMPAHGNVVQGTARPTHYYVIHDEIGFKADEIQGVTNALSYTFARATQAVSLVSPAYYADLACRRGRCYLPTLFLGYVGEVGTTGGEDATEQNAMQETQRLWGWGVSGAGLKETMFYL